MNNHVVLFLRLLKNATQRIDNPYFALPIEGLDLPEYRERVYAYELYHQLRSIWPRRHEWPFVLNGEVDKRGHPLIQGDFLRNTKPDLLVHQPGNMKGNLIVLEIKPAKAEVWEIAHDLQKLNAFCSQAQYTLGILLFFGEPARNNDLKNRCHRALKSARIATTDRLVVLWQCGPLQSAEPVTPLGLGGGAFPGKELHGKAIGRTLNQYWNIGAKQALYHKDGTWYQRLKQFPGALCDVSGYILFQTESDFHQCSRLRIGKQVNVVGHVSEIPGYVRVRNETLDDFDK